MLNAKKHKQKQRILPSPTPSTVNSTMLEITEKILHLDKKLVISVKTLLKQ